MLKGLNKAWFQVYLDSVARCEYCSERRGDDFAILRDDDRWALHYQLADARRIRSLEKLRGPGPVSSRRYYGNGKVEDTTKQEQRRHFLNRARESKRAKLKLKELKDAE